MTAAAPLGKDLLGLEPLSGEQIKLILDTAEPFKEISERAIKKVPTLRGSTVVNLFFENSTRTRISFEFAEKRLSADTVNVSSGGSSVSKGETLVDTARNLEAMRIDMVVIRHPASGAAAFLAERIESNVINAGDGTHEHPTQGLLDLLTLAAHDSDTFNRWQAVQTCALNIMTRNVGLLHAGKPLATELAFTEALLLTLLNAGKDPALAAQIIGSQTGTRIVFSAPL